MQSRPEPSTHSSDTLVKKDQARHLFFKNGGATFSRDDKQYCFTLFSDHGKLQITKTGHPDINRTVTPDALFDLYWMYLNTDNPKELMLAAVTAILREGREPVAEQFAENPPTTDSRSEFGLN